VGTDPAARRRGLAAALMRLAIADAAAAGCTTTTLQATQMGRPLYRGLGYEELGEMRLWEHRSRC
jgi:ribosomal protein S18 acetylase RimI-like enzyme